MKVFALVSGGKDSCFAMVECVRQGHEIVALGNLKPVDKEVKELDSFMFQTVGHEALDLYASCLGDLPLFRWNLARKSLITDRDYLPNDGDEVEDLLDLVKHARSQVDFDAVCTGAILSDYQRVRVENVCSRLGLVSLSYLWRRDQHELLQEMVNSKIEAVLIKVATLGLNEKHLGKDLAAMQSHLHAMSTKYGINVCGEGGEFETFTLDCPLFTKKLQISESEVFIHSDDAFAKVALLRLKKLNIVNKEIPPEAMKSQINLLQHHGVKKRDLSDFEVGPRSPKPFEDPEIEFHERSANVVWSGPWFHVRYFSAKAKDLTEATILMFESLKEALQTEGCSLSDLVFVTLFIQRMSDYSLVNTEYVKNFGLNPPARVCVEMAHLSSQNPLIMIAQGIRKQNTEIDGDPIGRKVMHVQSISHWAPANIGPYSQAVKVDGLIFIAGQIGLDPGSMLLPNSPEMEAKQALKNLSRIIGAHKRSLEDVIQCTCYVNDSALIPLVEKLWNESVGKRPSMHPVVVSGLPRFARVEWQVLVSSEDLQEHLKVSKWTMKLRDHLKASFDVRCLASKSAEEEEEEPYQERVLVFSVVIAFESEAQNNINLSNLESVICDEMINRLECRIQIGTFDVFVPASILLKNPEMHDKAIPVENLDKDCVCIINGFGCVSVTK